MKLACVILDSSNEGNCWNADGAIEKITNKKYYSGQDDGKYFVAVDVKDKYLLEKIFPSDQIVLVDYDDYPWDYDYRRDFKEDK